MDLCSDINLLADNKVDKDVYPSYFLEHRFDQSILSLLCKKHKIEPYRDPSQFGVFPEMYRNNGTIIEVNVLDSPYKTTIVLIRKSHFLVEYIKFNTKLILKKFSPKIYEKLLKK